MDLLSEELFEILKYKRYKLVNFIKEHGDYEILKLLLIKIENKYTDEYEKHNVIRSLFLGNIGYKFNAQNAFYELPTKNLLVFIQKLCELLDIKDIEEIMSGTGLLSKCLSETTDLNIVCTDGNRWHDTYSENRFYDVEKKYIEEYNYSDPNKLFIMSWPYLTNENVLNFFNKVEPTICIILIERENKFIKLLNENLKENYKILNIPVKQLCYKDYFKINKYFPEDSCRSTVYLYYNNQNTSMNNILSIENLKNNIGLNNFASQINNNLDKKMYIQDLIADKIIPSWILELDENKFNKAIYIIGFFLSKHIIIPKFINTLKKLIFYYNRKKDKKFPTFFDQDEKKFEDYYELINILFSNDGFEKIKNMSFLPIWINTLELADQYLFLDYSTSIKNKKWKLSELSFRNQYRALSTQINN